MWNMIDQRGMNLSRSAIVVMKWQWKQGPSRKLPHLLLVPHDTSHHNSGNGLWPVRCQAIIWTNADVNWTLRNKLQWNPNPNTKLFIRENAVENVVNAFEFVVHRKATSNVIVHKKNQVPMHYIQPPGWLTVTPHFALFQQVTSAFISSCYPESHTNVHLTTLRAKAETERPCATLHVTPTRIRRLTLLHSLRSYNQQMFGHNQDWFYVCAKPMRDGVTL